jgi:C-terminal processing protease CtpA/Prc
MWLLQQRQQQRKLQEQGRQLQSAEAILAREGDHPTSPGTAATADSAGISAGDEATSITGVQSKEGVLNNVKLGELHGTAETHFQHTSTLLCSA